MYQGFKPNQNTYPDNTKDRDHFSVFFLYAGEGRPSFCVRGTIASCPSVPGAQEWLCGSGQVRPGSGVVTWLRDGSIDLVGSGMMRLLWTNEPQERLRPGPRVAPWLL